MTKALLWERCDVPSGRVSISEHRASRCVPGFLFWDTRPFGLSACTNGHPLAVRAWNRERIADLIITSGREIGQNSLLGNGLPFSLAL
jgi:hypothetical protein